MSTGGGGAAADDDNGRPPANCCLSPTYGGGGSSDAGARVALHRPVDHGATVLSISKRKGDTLTAGWGVSSRALKRKGRYPSFRNVIRNSPSPNPMLRVWRGVCGAYESMRIEILR